MDYFSIFSNIWEGEGRVSGLINHRCDVQLPSKTDSSLESSVSFAEVDASHSEVSMLHYPLSSPKFIHRLIGALYELYGGYWKIWQNKVGPASPFLLQI